MTTANNWEQVTAPAARYERDLVPALFEPWARELVAIADPQPGERALDLACGTGIVARLTAARVSPTGTVTGVDVNPDMLAVAQQVSIGTRIEFRLASATDTDLPDAGFDVGFCQQGLQFFRDRRAALRELHRLMAPSGRIAVSVWCDPHSPGYAPFWPAFQRHLPEIPDAVGFLEAIFSLADDHELHNLLTEAGFRRVRIERRTGAVRYPSAAAWTQAFLGGAPIPGLATLPAKRRDRITSDVAAALERHIDATGLTFSIDAHIATAYR